MFWIEWNLNKITSLCSLCTIGKREVWAFYAYYVCYASIRSSMANNGGNTKHVRKNHWIIQNNSCFKIIYITFTNNFFTDCSFNVFQTYLHITFSKKIKIKEKLLFITFWPLSVAYCNICLVLVRWITYLQTMKHLKPNTGKMITVKSKPMHNSKPADHFKCTYSCFKQRRSNDQIVQNRLNLRDKAEHSTLILRSGCQFLRPLQQSLATHVFIHTWNQTAEQSLNEYEWQSLIETMLVNLLWHLKCSNCHNKESQNHYYNRFSLINRT